MVAGILVFGRIRIEQVLCAKRQGHAVEPAVEKSIGRLQVEQGARVGVDGIGGPEYREILEIVVVVEPGKQPPRPPAMVCAQREAERRVGVLDLGGPQVISDLRVARIDLGGVPVTGKGEHGSARPAVEPLQRVGRHDIQPLGSRAEVVVEVADLAAHNADAGGGQGGFIGRGEEEILAEHNPPAHLHIIVVGGDGQAAERDDRTEAEAG